MQNQRILMTFLATLVLLTAGCLGAVDDPADPGNLGDDVTNPGDSKDDVTDPGDPGDDVTESRETVTITHALGETTITGVPERVVALEWTYAEDLLAVGVTPVGLADVDGYRAWVNIDVPLPEDVVDVGTRQEPSLEEIAALEPDLIIGVKFRHEAHYETLKSIAPTLIFDPYPGEDGPTQYTEMEETFLAVADAVDRKDAARDVLRDLNAHYADVGARVADADLPHNEIVLAQAFTWNDAPTLRLFTQNAMASEIAARVGLENAWDDGFQTYGFSTVSLEALEPVENASFLYVAQADDNVFENQWKDHPVWTNLTFVKEDRVFPLGGDTWLFGGPLSAKRAAEKMAESVGA